MGYRIKTYQTALLILGFCPLPFLLCPYKCLQSVSCIFNTGVGKGRREEAMKFKTKEKAMKDKVQLCDIPKCRFKDRKGT